MVRAGTAPRQRLSDIVDSDNTNVRVLIVDDHEVVREGLRRMLEMVGWITVIGEACDGEEAIEQAVLLQPDVIIMDLKMPRMDGIEATRNVRQRVPCSAILILTLYAEDFVRLAIEAGASGYLLKDSDCDQLIKAIDQVHHGLCPIAPSLTRGLVAEFARLSQVTQAQMLTKRQTEIIKLIAEGYSGKEIGNRLFISTSTVKREIRQILTKLGVNDRAHAVSEAIRQKLI